MSRDFYYILGVSKTSSAEQIIEAYKNLSLHWHPDINRGRYDPTEIETNFQSISEAFQVLSHPTTRPIYDQYGESQLNMMYRSGREVYQEYFGQSSYSVPKDPAIIRDFQVSLPELFFGTVKKFVITRNVCNSGLLESETKTLEINVRPGWRAGTKITFPREGDERPNTEAADLVFVLKEKPHDFFTREKDNLVYSADITLKQALCGIKISLPTLDGDNVLVQLNDPISPDKVHVIPGRGMPNSKTLIRGDLIVKFKIQFPAALEKNQKEYIKSALQDVTWKST
jgi:DnaJ family protein B protein 4